MKGSMITLGDTIKTRTGDVGRVIAITTSPITDNPVFLCEVSRHISAYLLTEIKLIVPKSRGVWV